MKQTTACRCIGGRRELRPVDVSLSETRSSSCKPHTGRSQSDVYSYAVPTREVGCPRNEMNEADDGVQIHWRAARTPPCRRFAQRNAILVMQTTYAPRRSQSDAYSSADSAVAG